MSNAAENELIALVSREQRGFRRILFMGFAALFLVVAMSAALGVYYYVVAQSLSQDSRKLQHQMFDTRRALDIQKNTLNDNQTALRRAYDEIRGADSNIEGADYSSDIALEAARIYLQRGGHSLASERMVEQASSILEPGARKSLFAGVVAMLRWQRSGEAIQIEGQDLPDLLAKARSHFHDATNDPELGYLGHNGLAWINYELASSRRWSYGLPACEAVWKEVADSAQGDRLGPQPLYWQAQCERKNGLVGDALRDYARASNESKDIGGSTSDDAELSLKMNAFHGLGTVLIASVDEQESADLVAARQLAEDVCKPRDDAPGSPVMRLAQACLDSAVALRQRLNQTANQQSGSRENLGFTYLRDNNYEDALRHAVSVEKTGLFAWNELVRALSASHVSDAIDGVEDPRQVEQEARLNVSLFKVQEFNLCELKTLLSPDAYEEARTIVADEHPDELDVACK